MLGAGQEPLWLMLLWLTSLPESWSGSPPALIVVFEMLLSLQFRK